MAYYDMIAAKWDKITGDEGGPFKRYVLNQRLLALLPELAGKSVLELGAGTGYFARILLRGQRRRPARLVVTDASEELLNIAKERHHVAGAEYLLLDVSDPYPFDPGSFDIILATMVFNEIAAPQPTAFIAGVGQWQQFRNSAE